MVKSKFNWSFFLFPGFLMILLIVAAGFIVYPFEEGVDFMFGVDITTKYFISILLMVIAFMIFFPLMQNVFSISIKENLINIKWLHKTKTICSDDIEFIDLITLRGSIWCINPISILIKLNEDKQTFNDKDELYIDLLDGIYKNNVEMEEALKKIFPDLIKQKKTSSQAKYINKPELYSGNLYTSFEFYFGLLFSLFIVIIGLYDKRGMPLVFLSPIILIFLFGTSMQMFFFMLTSEELIIKNHFFFWYEKKILTDDIAFANYYYPPKRAKALLIVTKKRKVKFYSAASLKETTWKQLMERLVDIG